MKRQKTASYVSKMLRMNSDANNAGKVFILYAPCHGWHLQAKQGLFLALIAGIYLLPLCLHHEDKTTTLSFPTVLTGGTLSHCCEKHFEVRVPFIRSYSDCK